MIEWRLSELSHLHAAKGRAISLSQDERLRAAALGGGLPYDLLDPHSFERLCFHLLLAHGAEPRFWGRPGTSQQGIDLVISDGQSSVVYQCKRYAEFSAAALEKAVRKFERDWLSRPELGRPKRFVLCTTASLNETVDWEVSKRRLAGELGIEIAEWHRETLDNWLRGEPGIVADAFGDRVADLFCGLAGQWDLELFRPLERGFDRLRIDRYLDLLEADQLVRDPRYEAAFSEIVSRSSVVLLEGRAGAGKTIAALDLAAAYPPSGARVFYLRADEIESLDRAFTGIKGRAFRPSIFVIDDAHQAFDKVERLVDRATSLSEAKFVLTARVPPVGMDLLSPAGTDFLGRLRASERAIDISVDAIRVGSIVSKKQPEWARPPIDRLMVLAGHDLAILDLILEAAGVEDLAKIDTLKALLPAILLVIFGAHSATAPQLKRLAALAQFDVAIPREVFPEPFEASRNAGAVERFVVAGGTPSALAFRHPSEGELMFRLLAFADGDVDVEAACAEDCAGVLLVCLERRGSAYVVSNLLHRLMRTRLNLVDDLKIKRLLLADPRLIDLVTSEDTPLRTLSLATLLCGDKVSNYPTHLAKRLHAMAAHPERGPARTEPLGLYLRSLQLADAAVHADFERRIGGELMARLIATQCDLMAAIGALHVSSHWLATATLEALTREDLARLAQRTVDQEGSVGALGVRLRELGNMTVSKDQSGTLADLLLERLGSEHIAHLVAARGDLVGLLALLANCSEQVAGTLLSAFADDDLAQLANRTVEREGSVGTLGVVLRELGKRKLPGGAGQTQADLFVERMGTGPMARIIAARGDLAALLKILADSPHWFAGALLEAITSGDLERLAQRTLERDGGVGTLNLALRQLHKRPVDADGKTQRDLLEERLEVSLIWRLVLGTGNLNHLSYLLSGLSPDYCARMLAPEAAPDVDGWIALARRGSFYDPARFARDTWSRLPAMTAERVLLAIVGTASGLATSSSWSELGSGLAALDKVADAPIRACLADAAYARINTVAVDGLRFENYVEAVGGITLLWFKRPELRPELGLKLWKLLPPKSQWPNTYELLLNARLLLSIARAPEITDRSAMRVLKTFTKVAAAAALDPRSARYHALYIWNLYALWLERGRSQENSFSLLHSATTWQGFVDVIRKRQAWRHSEDKLDTLMLAGVLALLVPELRPTLVSLVRGKIVGIPYLSELADRTSTCIPAILVAHGLALSASPRAIFTADRVALISEKSKIYEERGPALDYLLSTLTS